MGDPCQGMPIIGVDGCKRPTNTSQRQPFLHVWVIDDILMVIEADELTMSDLPKGNQDRRH